MSVRNTLSFLTILILNSSCAFAFGTRRGECQDPQLPSRPIVTNCIANADGTGFCNGQRVSVVNFVCREPTQHELEQIWIKDVLRIIEQ